MKIRFSGWQTYFVRLGAGALGVLTAIAAVAAHPHSR
jgi:hypothetical protein